MKKLLAISLLMGMLSISLFAGRIEGTIATIEEGHWGTLVVVNKTAGGQTSAFPIISTDAEKYKRLYALALTAKGSNATVEVVSEVISGKAWLTVITIK